MKTKIEVRAKALELAMLQGKAFDDPVLNIDRVDTVINTADRFEKYILGDAELPECELSTEEAAKWLLKQTKELYESFTKTPSYPSAMGIVDEYFAKTKKDGE